KPAHRRRPRRRARQFRRPPARAATTADGLDISQYSLGRLQLLFLSPARALALQHLRYAKLRIVENDHTIHALETFRINNGAAFPDRAVTAFHPAHLARRSAFLPARNPVPAADNTQSGES